ncbi:MAG: hypothetical protein DELT_01721 [Desulfovibrio sp.]
MNDDGTKDMITALQSPEMRRVLLRIVQKSNLLHLSYAPGDSHATAFNEGLRAMGVFVKGEIDKADKDAFSVLVKETKR